MAIWQSYARTHIQLSVPSATCARLSYGVSEKSASHRCNKSRFSWVIKLTVKSIPIPSSGTCAARKGEKRKPALAVFRLAWQTSSAEARKLRETHVNSASKLGKVRTMNSHVRRNC